MLYGGEYWFLYSLFLMFMIFPVIDSRIRSSTARQLAAVALYVALKFVPDLLEAFLIKRSSYHFLYFVGGYVLKRHVDFTPSARRSPTESALCNRCCLLCDWLECVYSSVCEWVSSGLRHRISAQCIFSLIVTVWLGYWIVRYILNRFRLTRALSGLV